VVATTTTTTTSAKSWAQIASPAKPEPSQAVREKDQVHPSSSRESGKADEDRQRKSKEKKSKSKEEETFFFILFISPCQKTHQIRQNSASSSLELVRKRWAVQEVD